MADRKCPYRVSILGLGSIGKRHLANLIAFRELISGVFIFDIDTQAAMHWVADQNLHGLSVTVSASLSEVASFRPDLVMICTPNESHGNDVMAFVDSDSTIFVEKPFVIDPDAGDRLIANHNRSIFVGANMRYHDPVVQAHQCISSGRLGKVYAVRAFFNHDLRNWRPGVDHRSTYSADAERGGGIVFDCIHELDYLGWLLGPAEIVSAQLKNYGILGIMAEECAFIQLLHAGEIQTYLHIDYLQPIKMRGLEILGSEGAFLWKSIGKAPESMSVKLLMRDGVEVLFDGFYEGSNEGYMRQMAELFAVLQGKEAQDTFLLTAESAVQDVRLVKDIQGFEQSGKASSGFVDSTR